MPIFVCLVSGYLNMFVKQILNYVNFFFQLHMSNIFS